MSYLDDSKNELAREFNPKYIEEHPELIVNYSISLSNKDLSSCLQSIYEVLEANGKLLIELKDNIAELSQSIREKH